jgi:hypothetical protein
MILKRLFAVFALCAAPAAAQTEHIVTGANPPAQYTVCAEDTLVLKKELGREWIKADGSRAPGWPGWNDRARSAAAGNWFETVGATKLRFVENVAGKGWIYAPVDASPCAKPVTPSKVLFGANISGGEASGSDVLRPTLEDWKGYIDRYGFGLIRYPFKLERMTPARIAELQVNVAYARSKNVPVMLDRHDYVWRAPATMAADWIAFARNFPDDGSVILDLVNEPGGFNDPVLTNDWEQWLRDSNAAIAMIRAGGIRHPIALEYPQWSASFRFDKKERPSTACASAGCAIDRGGGLHDPLGLTIINAHRYFDKDASGTSKVCKDVTSGLVEFADQLRRRNLKAYITEAAFGSSYGVDPSCKAVGAETIAALKANSDVLLGVTWWGGGRIWPEKYLFKIDAAKATRYTVPLNPYLLTLLGR